MVYYIHKILPLDKIVEMLINRERNENLDSK